MVTTTGTKFVVHPDGPADREANVTVTSLVQGDPDPSLFELPKGFKVLDHRRTPPP